MEETPFSRLHSLQSLGEGSRVNRREFLHGLGLATLLGGVSLAGCAPQEQESSQPAIRTMPAPAPRLRAAFSYDGMKSSWSRRGSETVRLIGKLLGIDVVHYDGELSVDKQRKDLEEIADQSWDFVAIHPVAVNAYLDPVRRMIARGIPVIDMDTRLADDLDTLGIVTFLEPDNIWMGEQVTLAIINAMQSSSFEIIHTQGQMTHTGAQGRAQGFHNVISRYPGIKVVDETPCDWDIDRVTRVWDDLLQRFPDVKAGFLHNDDMAMSALRSINKANKTGQVLVGCVDGMQEACAAVAAGDLVATALNPTGRIHGGALWIGYYLATSGGKENVPRFIRVDGGVINKGNAAGYQWQGEHLMI